MSSAAAEEQCRRVAAAVRAPPPPSARRRQPVCCCSRLRRRRPPPQCPRARSGKKNCVKISGPGVVRLREKLCVVWALSRWSGRFTRGSLTAACDADATTASCRDAMAAQLHRQSRRRLSPSHLRAAQRSSLSAQVVQVHPRDECYLPWLPYANLSAPPLAPPDHACAAQPRWLRRA